MTTRCAESIEDELREIWQGSLALSGYEYFVAVRCVTDAASCRLVLGDPRPFSGASMIKTFLLELVLDDVMAGRLSWGHQLTLAERHRALGDGILAGWDHGAEISLRSTCSLMIALSDNTATNMVIEALGGTCHVNDRLAAKGIRSRLKAWVGGRDADERVLRDGELWSRPAGVGLSAVYPLEHEAVVERMCTARDQTGGALLCRQLDRRALARGLQPDVVFAHKTGTVGGLRHDGGIIAWEGARVSVTCFTDGPDRPEAVDDPMVVAMGGATAETLRRLGLEGTLLPRG